MLDKKLFITFLYIIPKTILQIEHLDNGFVAISNWEILLDKTYLQGKKKVLPDKTSL